MAATRGKTASGASAASTTSAERASAPARHAASTSSPSAPAAPKKTAKTPARRGPRRTVPARPGTPQGSDLEALRTALKASVVEHHPTADLAGVDRGVDLAVEAHEGQRRATGEPYVSHPIASAQILAELGIDPVAILTQPFNHRQLAGAQPARAFRPPSTHPAIAEVSWPSGRRKRQ